MIPMLPATNLFFTVGTLVAERLLYMPSVGLVLLAGHAATSLSRRYPALLVYGVCAAALAVGARRTLERTADWADDERLYLLRAISMSTYPHSF